MKKSTMILLLVLSVILVAAGALVAAGFGWHYSGSSYDSSLVGEFFPEELTGADVRLSGLDVRIYDGSWDKTLQVEVSDSALKRVSVEVLDGVLTIREKRSSGLARFLGGRRTEGFVLLWIPKGCQWPLNVVNSSGEITFSGARLEETPVTITSGSGEVSVYDSRLQTLTASVGSGDVYLSDSWIGGASFISAGSGDVSLYETEAAELGLEASSGDILFSGSKGTWLDVVTSSGDVTLAESALDGLSVVTSSGDGELEQGTVDSATVDTTSGNVKLSRAELRRAQLRTTSGKVWGVLTGSAADYTVSVSTTSGSSTLTPGGSGPRSLDISTTSGNVELVFAE